MQMTGPLLAGAQVALAGQLLAGLLPSGPVFTGQLPQRKAGLWVVTSEDNAFADRKRCVDDTRYNLLDSDVWSDFGDECVVPPAGKGRS